MLDIIVGMIVKIVAGIFLLSAAVYLAFVFYYRNVFMVNTWINGIYCTGKTLEDVNSELLSAAKAPTLILIGTNGKSAEIDMAQADYRADYTEHIKALIDGQNTYLWPKYVRNRKEYTIEPAFSWNTEKMTDLVINNEVTAAFLVQEPNVEIVLTEEGYELKDTTKNLLDTDKLVSLVCENFQNGITETDLLGSNCFYDLEDNAQQAQVRKLWSKTEEILNCKIVYDMGTEQILLDPKVLSSFLQTDENGMILSDEQGNIMIDADKTDAFVEELIKAYDTCDTILSFSATRGEIVKVPYVTYGTKINAKAEKMYLREAVKNHRSEVHAPSYIKKGYVRGKDDIGDTYIEIDMTAQKMYCYKEGERIIETDIVTGNMKRKWATPAGVNYIYKKQRNRILRGKGYASPVDYWMPVKGSIGIHDADWRKKFGGEIYKTSGSHGCINVPPDIMPDIYDKFEVGTPVIMFY